ncbi:MAG: hypothetical protein Ct9H90mP22_7410 [Gammaproteobacteria bacterium]|nr:MAG: hypothetical protein Ct9H90mP22_7410 [Gammaproteobacteria bacterium]
MGYADIGEFQDEKISTPNLDLMAKWPNMDKFLRKLLSMTPSRAGFLNPEYCQCEWSLWRSNRCFFPLEENWNTKNQLTLAEVFQTNGYSTGIFGKWHLGMLKSFFLKGHGFDEYVGIPIQMIWIGM